MILLLVLNCNCRHLKTLDCGITFSSLDLLSTANTQIYFTYQKYYPNATQVFLNCTKAIRKVKSLLFWQVWRVIFVDFTPQISTINTAFYNEILLIESNRLFGKRDQDVDQTSSYAKRSTSYWCRNLELIEILRFGNSSTSNTQS